MYAAGFSADGLWLVMYRCFDKHVIGLVVFLDFRGKAFQRTVLSFCGVAIFDQAVISFLWAFVVHCWLLFEHLIRANLYSSRNLLDLSRRHALAR